MPGPIVDLDRLAMILVEASFFGDRRAAEKWGITARTVHNYRKRLNTDAEFSKLFNLKRQEYQQDWIEDIPATVRNGIQWLSQAFNKLEPTAENVHAITGAIKILTEIGLTKELVDARLGKFSLPERTEDN